MVYKSPGVATNYPRRGQPRWEAIIHNIPRTPEEYRQWWQEQRPDIPYGYCWCGCGRKTTISKVTTNRYLTGEPKRFLKTHGGSVDRSYLRAGYKVEDRGFTSSCWVWQGHQTKGGYCLIFYKGQSQYAHRVFFEQKHGSIPKGLQLDHLCCVPACVNPSHLEPVTAAENVRRSTRAKLSLEDARKIRALAKQGDITKRAMSEMFPVHETLIGQIIAGKVWKE